MFGGKKMKKNKLIINEENFRRYLENRMSESERHRFERELQKHPFETEAMEGYEKTPTKMKKDLEEIKNRIGKRKRKNTYRYWAAAASVLLMVTAGLIWYQLGKEPPIAEMAVIEREKQEEKTAAVKDSAIEKEDVVREDESREEKAAELLAKKENTPAEPADTRSPKQPAMAAAGTESSEEITVDEKVSQEIVTAKNNAAGVTRDTKRVAYDLANRQRSAQAKLKSIATAENSTIKLTGKEQYPVDSNDIFPDSFRTISPGVYETVQEIQGVAVQDNVERKSDHYLSDIAAHPQGGMERYRKYLEKQAVLPENYPHKKETVKLLLEIDSRGNVADIRQQVTADSVLVERSKNIIHNGPAWSPKIVNGKKIQSEVPLEINFHKK